MRRNPTHRFLSALLSLVMVISLFAGTGVFTAFAEEADVDVYAEELTNTLGQGLKLYSNFNDGTAKDLSGNGHDGTVKGAIEFVTVEGDNKALRIKGQNADHNDDLPGDRYVDYGPSKFIIPDTGDFTLSLWYKSEGESSNSTLLSNKNFKSGSNVGFAMGCFANDLRMNLTDVAKSRKDIQQSSGLLFDAKDGEMHHLLVTVDRSGSMTYYVDGVKASSTDISGIPGSIDVGLNLVLGAGGNYCNATNNCLLDELLIYDRVVTADEIALLAKGTAPDLNGTTPDYSLGIDNELILFSNFDSVKDGKVLDLSGNEHDGVVTGPLEIVPGLSGTSVKFTGQNIAGGDNQKGDRYINYGKSKNIIPETESFTVSFWFKSIGQTQNNASILGTKNYASAGNTGIVIGCINQELVYNISAGSNYEIAPGKGSNASKWPDMVGQTRDQQWHLLTAVYDRESNLVAYVDGKQVATTSISGNRGSIDAGLDLILGAGGNGCNAANNCWVDSLRIYKGALNADEVKTLFLEHAEDAGAFNIVPDLEKLMDELNGFKPSVVFTEEAIADMKGIVKDALKQATEEELTVEETTALLESVMDAYQEFCNGAEPLANFHMISDVHINGTNTSDINTVKYVAGMKDMAAIFPETAIAFVNAGDFAQSGTAAQYQGFYAATKANDPVTDAQTLVLLGNHDVRGSNSADWNKDPSKPELCKYWPTAKALYLENNIQYMNNEQQLYHTKELGGYTFIMLNTELGLKDSIYMSEAQVKWFEETMKAAYEKDPNKPVFIISHQSLNNTHFRGNNLDGFGGINADGSPQPYCTHIDEAVKEVMAKYPNGVFLSGHIHNGFGLASTIPTNYGLAVDVPAYNESENALRDKGVGYEVMIYDGYLALRARNFATSTWMPEYDVIVPTGEHNYTRLIQILEPYMSNLDKFMPADYETLQTYFGDFWSVVDQSWDHANIAWNSAPPADKAQWLFTPDKLTNLEAAAELAWANLDKLDGMEMLDGMGLAFGRKTTGTLVKGTPDAAYLVGIADTAIESVVYSVSEEDAKKVDVNPLTGEVAVKEGVFVNKGDIVTVNATVTYYTNSDNKVLFVDNFVAEKRMDNQGNYKHSDVQALFGNTSCTPWDQSKTDGGINWNPAEPLVPTADKTYTVSAWIYSTAPGTSNQEKFAVGVSAGVGNGTNVGVIQTDGQSLVSPDGDGYTGEFVTRGSDNGSVWYRTKIERQEGWHRVVFTVTPEGTKADLYVNGTEKHELGLMKPADGGEMAGSKLDTQTNLIKQVKIWCNWARQGQSAGATVIDKLFADGLFVIETGAKTAQQTLSTEVALEDISYTVVPASFEVDSTYPTEQSMIISPYMAGETDVVKVLIDGKEIASDLWTAAQKNAPYNAQNFPAELKGYELVVLADAFKGLSEGEHTLTIITDGASQMEVPFTAHVNDHVATDYYLSNNTGDDSNDGHTAATAWKTFEKLQSVTFGPGDRIFLDAESTWSGVQFRPEGSGAPGAPIVLTKYNDGGDSSKRPVLNGDGTLADLQAHSYLAFDAWRAFYPSGTVELFNVEHWEVSGLEVTNYAQEMQKGATGRNGIAVIYDYFETQGITELSGNAEMERQFYRAGKLQHVVIEDCYVHDVVGYHPINGAQGRGGKMSGGINAYGPYDDLQINNNIVMYCDVEGIRNDVLAWMGDTRTQFPPYMNDVSISNNYIAGVPGDGVVISSADRPILENNYLTDAGYSYYATSNTNNVQVPWSAGNLASCKDVATKTGAVANDMGNRDNPRTMGSTNFAGLWFIGTKDAVAQYNEAVNNVWVCNDSEAFDADMFCWGTIFQYNYTYRNNGGFALFMGSMDDGTVVRYNVSVEDAQSVGISESQNGTFHYSGAPEAIHNNLFILGDKVATMFGGPANTTYFYNNIVIAPNGLTQNTSFNGFHLNGSSDSAVANPRLAGEMKNNIFYPAKIVESIVEGSPVVLENNIILKNEEEMKSLFVDLDGFLAAQPVKALLGRSDFHGTPVNMEFEKGAGVAMSVEDGRKVTTPTGGFDYRQFAGIMLSENSPAIGAGTSVMHDYSYKAQNDASNPLTTDFFKNDISNQTAVDIGPHQFSNQHEHDFVVEEAVAATCCSTGLTEGRVCSICGWIDAVPEVTPVDPENHAGGTELRDVVEATTEHDGYTGDLYCLGCGALLEEGEVIEKLPVEEPEKPFIPNRPAPVKPVGPTAPEFPFTDVHENDWFYEEVKSAWENDLVDGVSATKYAPNETLTVASAIKLAAALHQMDNDGYVSLKNGAPVWYSTYVDYAVKNGVIEESYLNYTAAQMNAPVTRAEFIHIFYGAMDNYDVINDVKDGHIPDVKMTDKYADEIYTFYRAGILTGCDSKGSCRPATVITRGEVAAILIRMYDVTARVSITL